MASGLFHHFLSSGSFPPRINIASGSGQNWWCVLYPGLCRAACGGYALPEENDLVCGDYILRLRFVDWWNRHTASRTTRVLAG